MQYFDFHHHKKPFSQGIYNLSPEENNFGNPFSVGLHPQNILGNWEANFEKIKEVSSQKNCVAIGECGLDATISIDETLQKKVLEAHIVWANEINKPVIIHCVRRFQELIPFQKIAKTPLIIHGFNKKKTIAEEMLKHGFYLSFGKSVLHLLSLQTLIKDFPIEKMFLETDDANFEIENLYLKVAEIKNISVEKLQKHISENLGTININIGK